MSTLTLVRHGQASQHPDDGGGLSRLGRAQAEKLGHWWIQRGAAIDEVYTGTLERQRQTARLVGERFAAAGLNWPEPRELAGLDEYDAPAVLRVLAPALAQRDARFADLAERAREAAGRPDQNRHFQRMFEVLIGCWIAGSIGAPGVESWPEFRERVRRALRDVTASGGNRRVVAFTSGGPIGVALQTTLSAPDQSAIDAHWRVRNCSLTEFVFSTGRFSLDTFNAVPHLDSDGLLSYR